MAINVPHSLVSFNDNSKQGVELFANDTAQLNFVEVFAIHYLDQRD